jgi:hypothetical protein
MVAGNGGEMPDTFGNSDARDTTSSGRAAAADGDVVSEVDSKYTRWRNERRPYESTWFVNAALLRGIGTARWNPVTNTLDGGDKAPAHRSRENINIILPKAKAKLSKFLKNRAIPVVDAASTDHEDILNAKATTKVLEYTWRRLSIEEKQEEALLNAMVTGKAFWWFFWNPTAMAQFREEQLIGKPIIHDLPEGDVDIEVGSAFELLVSDPSVMRLKNQPEIMRIKSRPVKDVEKMFKLEPGTLTAEISENELFQYQRQIANLGAKSSVGYAGSAGQRDSNDQPTHVVVKELFTAPCAAYPKGRYVVVAAKRHLNKPEPVAPELDPETGEPLPMEPTPKHAELPYGFADTTSPYPGVEFCDQLSPGQFWPTTMVEQMVGVQKQYSRLRNQLDEQLKLQTHPWIFIPKQAGIHENAFSSEAGQKIPFNFQPGMPPPQQWIVRPEAIVGDVYRTMDIIRNELDTITNIYPASMGASGATSGFDTNLLQEAADSVHAPDIRRNELTLQEAAYKMRRIIKLGYDVPRLITIVGRDKSPEVFEFSAEQIDEHANIHIDTGSALPDMKHARIEAILKLDERQAFGPIGDPTRNRKLLRMLDLGSYQETTDLLGADEDHARLENLSFTKGEAVEDPMPWEDHDVEYEIHTNLLKSPEIKSWPPEQRGALVRHVILHVKWKNPQSALQLAMVFGLQDVVQEIQALMSLQQSTAPPAPPAQPGAPPQGGGPQGPPPSPQAPPAPAQ